MSKNFEKKIENLKTWNRQALLAEWQRIRGGPPPKSTSPQFMMRVISYHWQEQELGGLSREAKKLLADLVRQYKKSPDNFTQQRLAFKPGTRMQRLWQGQIHEVTVMSDGKLNYRSQVYGSLSEIARLITGSRWNGHVFFGLKKSEGKTERRVA
jgi:hypothetical protein